MSAKRILGVCALLVAGLCHADTLLLDSVQTDAQSSASRPRPGSTMTSVEASFGAPSERRAAVGDPPIARWEYPSFIVYFEYDRVIHTVVRH